MRIISLWQPWAHAIVTHAKRVETRGKAPPRGSVGELLAIHAALRWTREERRALERLDVNPEGLVFGAVVAVGTLVSAEEMTEEMVAACPARERELGGWVPGRWAWTLRGVRALLEPLPLKGRQGPWRLERADAREVTRRASAVGVRPVPDPVRRFVASASRGWPGEVAVEAADWPRGPRAAWKVRGPKFEAHWAPDLGWHVEAVGDARARLLEALTGVPVGGDLTWCPQDPEAGHRPGVAGDCLECGAPSVALARAGRS